MHTDAAEALRKCTGAELSTNAAERAELTSAESRESSNSGRKAEASLRGPLLVEHTVGGFGYSPRGAVAGFLYKNALTNAFKNFWYRMHM